MSKTSKAITNHIRATHYPTTPLGEELFIEEPIAQTIEEIRAIPAVEKAAMRMDIIPIDQDILDDPLGHLKKKCQSDTLFLMQFVLGFKDVAPGYPHKIPHYSQIVADFLEQYAPRMMVMTPRWHFKTSFGVAHIIQSLLRNPNETWMIESANEENAYSIFEMIQRKLETDEMRLIWDDLRGNRWNQKGINILGRTIDSREPNVFWKGIESDTTGLHPRNGYLDDLSAEKNSESPEQIQSVIDHYEYKMFNITKRILMTCTRWNFGDLPGYLKERNEQIPRDNPMYYKILELPVYDKDTNEPLFPEMYPVEWIENKRRELASYKFHAQMMLNPVNPDEQIFKIDDKWPYYHDFHQPEDYVKAKMNMNYFITDDPASSKSRGADYTALVVCGVTEDKKLYVVDYVRRRMSPSEHIREMFRLVEKWQPMRKLGIERGAYENMLKESIEETMEATGVYFSRKKLKPGNQPGARSAVKFDRVLSLQPMFENGRIYIGRDMDELIEELMFFPFSKHDDLVDALAYQRQLIFPPGAATEADTRTPVQIARDRRLRNVNVGRVRRFLSAD